jgi:hypothetical protein
MEQCLSELQDDLTELRVRWKAPQQAHESFVGAVFLVIDEEAWNNDIELRQAAIRVFHRFIAILRGCPGIEIDDLSAPVNGGSFSWQMMKETDRWDFANLTARDD